jgi:hypothetical protein
MVSRVFLPVEVKDLAVATNTPIELFAGVSLFLALKITDKGITCSRKLDHGANKKEEFIALCKELCKRHDLSRQVFQHKKSNRGQSERNNGKVVTFIPEQHNKVVGRMYKDSLERGRDAHLHANIIDWIAAVNAGWQDMGINERKGPFVTPVTETSRFEIRDPHPLKMV